MEGKNAGILEALGAAMEAEKQANRFYLEAMDKAGSGRGRDLLRQLAAFEEAHYEKLKELEASLQADEGYVRYDGTSFASITGEIPVEADQGAESNLDDVLGILNLAIDAESSAYERYKRMARDTDDPAGKDMFVRFAQEELLHRRILSDEFYHLNNRGGVWSWGD